jgi:hypothetical protein
MATIDVDFEWPVAVGGYEVCDYGARPGPPTLLAPSSALIKIAALAAGGIAASEPPSDLVRVGPWGTHLVPCGATLRWHQPLAFHPFLFMQFATLDQRAAACAEFASNFGLLLTRGEGTEDVEIWFHHIGRFRRLVDLWQSGPPVAVLTRSEPDDLREAAIGAKLVWRDGRPGLSMTPDTLISALRLQFMQAIADMREIKSCDQCGRWFERGPGKDRRGKSRFCSDACRFGFHNERRSKGG